MNSNKDAKLNQPIVGVLTRKKRINLILKQDPPLNLERIQKANEEANLILYFFSYEDIDTNKKVIMGTYFNKEKWIWERKSYNYPDFVYKRCGVSEKYNKIFEKFYQQLKELSKEPLNYYIRFNKWEVIQHISSNKNLLPYLPPTYLYSNPKNFKKIINSTDTVYLKALHGGRGRKVIRVRKLATGEYEYKHSLINNLNIGRTRSFKGLMKKVLQFYENKDFIIQKAIDLIRIDNRLVDMRAEIQRESNGEITVTAISLRVGKAKSPITTHEKSYNFEYFFSNFMNYSDKKIYELKNRINCFLKKIYKCIEEKYGPSAEIGIDIGLDKNNRLWFIECNSRSMKTSFFNTCDESTINKSFINLLEYAKFRYNKK